MCPCRGVDAGAHIRTDVSRDALASAFELFWHPVCAESELAACSTTHAPFGAILLGRRLVIAQLAGGALVAMDARCPHRSASLARGTVEEGGLRCAYHGWRFDSDGRCDDIPSMPGGPIPSRAAIRSHDVVLAYGLVWVRLDDAAGTELPRFPEWGNASFRLIAGEPYTWPVGAPRRVENFVDLAHFAFVHDGSLGRRSDPVPPVPDVARADAGLLFVYDPPDIAVEGAAMYGRSVYRMPMPLTVSIEFELGSGAKRFLWMTASPIDMGTSRSFWWHGRNDDVDGDDAPYVAFQARVLAEDEPVVCSQDPAPLPLDPAVELSVRTDKVSIEYRRFLRDLAEAAHHRGPAGLAAVLAATSIPAGDASQVRPFA
jgi:phenylpropionate dioxygenase-like ring-hydroxylating dioxygenase large terminal subunit